jgi:alcohol dehydrogenase
VIDAFNALRRGGRAVNIGGVSENTALGPGQGHGPQQKSLIGSLWFSTAEGEDMAAMG